MKYRIEGDMKFLKLPSGQEIKTEATELEILLWDMLREPPSFQMAVERVLLSCYPDDNELQLIAVNSLLGKICVTEDWDTLHEIKKDLENKVYGEE